jgi:tRNA 2-thiouridine synthesizing protein A
MTTKSHGVVPTTSLDTSGLVCPLPVYKASLALKGLATGEVLELICTDPGSLADIPTLVRRRGDSIIRTEDLGDRQVFWIERG